MKIVVCPDKFKGCLTAAEAARLMARGLRRRFTRARIVELPLADGGDGTGDVLARALGGLRRRTFVRGPRGEAVKAASIWFPRTRVGLVELAQASGLWRLAPRARDPLKTSTHGTGALIRRALKAGPKALWIGVGGSATVDGGAGLLQALGARLILRGGRVLERPATGADLEEVAALDLSALARLPPVTVLCDVDNPLTGPRGAAPAFGPQKGASPKDVARLARGLRRWGELLGESTGRRVLGLPRGGAAGGAAAGLAAVFGARLVSGAGAVLDAVGFRRTLRGAKLVVTGEGRVDRTTMEGKIVGEVLKRARRAGVPVAVLAGRRGSGWQALLKGGTTTVAEIAPGLSDVESIRLVRTVLPRAAERLETSLIPSLERRGQKGKRKV